LRGDAISIEIPLSPPAAATGLLFSFSPFSLGLIAILISGTYLFPLLDTVCALRSSSLLSFSPLAHGEMNFGIAVALPTSVGILPFRLCHILRSFWGMSVL